MLALRKNGDLESRQRPVVYPAHILLRLVFDILGGLLEGLEARDEDVGEEQQAVLPGGVLAEAAQDPGCDELAEGRSTEVHILAVAQVRLLVKELGPVD